MGSGRLAQARSIGVRLGGLRRAGRPIRRRWRTGSGGLPGSRRMPMPIARSGLPVPGGPREITFSSAVTKSSVRRAGAMRSPSSPRPESESNSSRLLRTAYRAPRIRPSTPWASRAATSRCKAGDKEFLVGPGLGRSSIGQQLDGISQCRRLQCPRQERDVTGQITPRAGVDLGAVLILRSGLELGHDVCPPFRLMWRPMPESIPRAVS